MVGRLVAGANWLGAPAGRHLYRNAPPRDPGKSRRDGINRAVPRYAAPMGLKKVCCGRSHCKYAVPTELAAPPNARPERRGAERADMQAKRAIPRPLQAE